ncbi:hypothetical protein LCGC14_1424680 [marine sediment metagenome]|uniref:Uncharacterized protein n=1 Tax=marine sediment metagenome TaxID=412755 RepID=A0A0F9MS20_9ZZZZ
MGVLYYIAKTDGSRELFALNKVYQYDREMVLARLTGVPLRDMFADEVALAAELTKGLASVGWFDRVAQRLFRWAGDATVEFMSEHAVQTGDLGQFHSDLTYKEHRALITGSAHDSDYEDDGVTYKPGSAW